LKQRPQVKSNRGRFAIAALLIFGMGIGFLIGYLVKPSDETVVIESEFETVIVSQVVDGDTVVLEDGRTVRYLGIDTPESGEPYSVEATEKNREFVEGKFVEIQSGIRDVDEYGRILRYVYVDGIFVNAELVAQGYATAFIFDPDDRFSQVLVQLEQYAKLRNLGIWGN